MMFSIRLEYKIKIRIVLSKLFYYINELLLIQNTNRQIIYKIKI